MMKMKNEEMELVNDNGTWKIKWNDGFERSFESFFKANYTCSLGESTNRNGALRSWKT